MTDELNRLAFTIGPEGTDVQLPFELVASGSTCSLHPVIRELPNINILDLAHDTQNNLWMAGSIVNQNSMMDMLLLKLSPQGDLLLANKFGSSEDNVARAITIDTQNSIWIVGETKGYGAVNSSDALIAKFSSGGVLSNAFRWGGLTDVYVDAVAVSSNGTVWAA